MQDKDDNDNNMNRKHIRSAPQPLEAVFIDFNCGRGTNWNAMQIALIEEGSPRGGCALVFQKYKFNKYLAEGSQVTLKFEDTDPIAAECIYIEDLNPKLLRVGFKFLD